MVDPHTNGCPEPEVLAAYVDRGLSLSERARLDAHLASCSQCIALVAGVARTVEELSANGPNTVVAAEATPQVRWRSWAGALAAAAAMIAVVMTPALVQPWLDRDSGLVSLVDSVGEQRSVLGRLTGGFPHAPLGVPSAGGQDGRAAGTDRVQLTAGKIRESFGERQTPSQLHALGVSYLLEGRYDDAAQSLLAASREQPANAQYLSDVAAAQLERARLGLRPDDLPRALAAADRARRLDPSLREALFNRALAATALSLTAEARSAWAEYLKRDSSSPWAAEAKSRLDELNKPTPASAWSAIEGRLQQPFDAATADDAVRTQTTEARNLIEKTIADWADAVLSGGDGSVELDRARTLAHAMLRVTGDGLYADAVAILDRTAAEDRSDMAQLASAHRDYAAALALFNADRFAAAAPAFEAVRWRLRNSPYEFLARVHQGGIAYVSGQSDTASTILANTLDSARSKGYSYAMARSTWFLGLIAVGQGRFADAQARYEDTLDVFDRIGDVEQAGAVRNALAALHDYLGDSTTAWRHRLIAFESLSVSRSLRFKYSMLSTAVPSMRRDAPETALTLQDAALAIAREWQRDGAIAETLAQRASILASLQRFADAEANLREASDHLALVPDAAFRGRIQIAVLSTESDLQRSRNPAAAVAAASQAVELIQQRRDRLRIAQLQLRIARANIVWGRTREARIALDKGLQAFNEERATSSERRPISALDESWQLFDTSVQLSLAEKDYRRAFALAEAARTRSIGEAKRFRNGDLGSIQTALGQDEALLALNQFEDDLAIWVIRRDRVNVTMRSVSRQVSKKLVARLQHDIWESAPFSAAGRDLYNEIVRPVSGQLAGATRLIIVPDATFQDASFSAFYSSARRRFLIEEVSLRMAPSAGAFTASASSAPSRAGMANPLIFDSAGSETATAIASTYGGSQLRSGADATRERFFSEVVDRRIVHVAARSAVNASYPLLSRLLVADDPGMRHSGVIMGSDIAERTLPGTGLVVIDEAGAPTFHRGEGTLSLARAFMAAGVPAVLGTLPGADENAIRDLMIGFHREISNGISAEQALSRVQRNALQQNGRRLGAWTALVLYGSDR